MLTTYKAAYNTMVYHQTSEGEGKVPVGVFLDFVINPDDGTAAALWLQTLAGKKLLSPHDILHWRSSEILIRDAHDCYDPEDQPKLKKIFAKECPILGTSVYSWPEKKLRGQVRNFGFDTISPRVLSLHVRPAWWQFWQRQIIPHERIHAITDKGIFVHDQAPLKSEAPLTKVSEAIKTVDERAKTDCEEP